jgi:hypothetical protein
MKILVSDHGLCIEAAITLARAGHKVGYSISSTDKHSHHDIVQMGSGFEKEGVEKVDFYTALSYADYVVCMDTYSGGEVDWLRAKGHKVWGAGQAAERLELDRWYAYSKMHDAGLPSADAEHVVGVPTLIEKLQKPGYKKRWIKCSGTRELETFFHEDWLATQETYIAPLLYEYGTDPKLEFMIVTPIDPAQEVGSDSLVINGIRPAIQPYGYEDKDTSYIGRFNSKVLPDCLAKINKVIDKELTNAISFVSTEARVTPDKKGYPIDLTIRAAHPPLAAMLECIVNISDIITRGSKGYIENILPNANYAAVLCGSSGWAEEHRMEIRFPERYRRYVKLAKAWKNGDIYYTIPSKNFPVQVVGLGETPRAAANDCMKHAKEVKGKELSFDWSSFDRMIDETIPEGKKHGIEF